ncbi:hypothetical protein [Kribbella sp. NPDC004536]|uniref:hypothetical protein n=1 Tax=Kribbella sp. NPDC004536 TaxID=3364106 RepID=UPI0036C63A88
MFSTWGKNAPHPGLNVAEAVDIYAGLCNVDVYRTFVDERGWSPDRVEEWVGRGART